MHSVFPSVCAKLQGHRASTLLLSMTLTASLCTFHMRVNSETRLQTAAGTLVTLHFIVTIRKSFDKV